MTRYMLDTNTCIFLAKNRSEVVGQYSAKKSQGIAISAIVVAELQFGVANSMRPEENAATLSCFLLGFELLDFDTAAAMEYGRICCALRRQGQPIGTMDMLIAAHAKAAGLTLVTNNTREFARVEGLLSEDWVT